jgi:hypothetical protein
MMLTVDEIIDIAEAKLDLSDFGNWFGNDDDIVEFVCEVIRREKEKEDGLVT